MSRIQRVWAQIMDKLLFPMKFFYTALHADRWPILSTLLVMLIAAFLAGVVWHGVGMAVKKDQTSVVPSGPTSIIVSGDCNAANSGNSGNADAKCGNNSEPETKDR